MGLATGLVALPVGHLAHRRYGLTVTEAVERLAPPADPGGAEPAAVARADQFAAGVVAAGRVWRIADRSCLTRATLTWWWCRRQGLDPVLWVGADTRDGFAAHAWVEVGGRALGERADVDRRYPRFPAPVLPRTGASR